MKKITLQNLEDLASRLAANDPECVKNASFVHDDGIYIGVLYRSPILSSSQVHMISRCLSGICWFIEKFDNSHIFISFNKASFLK